jgi:hypothetical protein
MAENKKPLYIFLHVPRTGGTSLNDVLLRGLGKNEVFFSGGPKEPLHKRIFRINDPNKLKAIIGHRTYYGFHKFFSNKKPKYILFVRDPAERLVSHYNFQMKSLNELIPFLKWYKFQRKNDMTHFLSQKYLGKESTFSSLYLLKKILSSFLKGQKNNFMVKKFLKKLFLKKLKKQVFFKKNLKMQNN